MSKAQIFPQPNPHAFCQVHNCRNVAKHFIGKPGAGSLLRLTYMVCDDCLRDIIASAPAEFLPQTAKTEPVTPVEALATVKAMVDTGEITKDMFLEAFMPLLNQWADKEGDETNAQTLQQPPVEAKEKEYTCKYCGEKFDTPPKLAAHVRQCPMNPKNQGGAKNDDGK